jgi:hypothetical protein
METAMIDVILTAAQLAARRRNIAIAQRVSAERRRLPDNERKRRKLAAMARYRLRRKGAAMGRFGRMWA